MLLGYLRLLSSSSLEVREVPSVPVPIQPGPWDFHVLMMSWSAHASENRLEYLSTWLSEIVVYDYQPGTPFLFNSFGVACILVGVGYLHRIAWVAKMQLEGSCFLGRRYCYVVILVALHALRVRSGVYEWSFYELE